MIGAVIGILVGLLSLFLPLPLMAPVLGMALGLNAVYQSRRAAEPDLRQYRAGIAAAGLGAIGIAVVLLFRTGAV